MDYKIFGFTKLFESVTTKPEKYLSVEENQIDLIKTLTKDLYDFTKLNENPKNKAVDVLEQLVVLNLDEEQIWQQIDLQNNSVCNSLVHEIAYLSGKKESLKFPLLEKEKLIQTEVKSNLSKQNTENKKMEDRLIKRIKKTPKGKSSVVDDKFFKLYEMENFLETAEKEEGKEIIGDSDLEYFSDDSSSPNVDNEKQLFYNDFFDEPEEEASDGNSEKSFDSNNKDHCQKKVKFLLNKKDDEDNDIRDNSDEEDELYNFENENGDDNGDNGDDDGDDGDDDGDDGNSTANSDYNEDHNGSVDHENDEDVEEKNKNMFKPPSTYEVRQERLKLRIENLEQEALKEKPWQLKGEVTATNRPQNSLLEEYVEFDIATRPAPVLTEKSTLKLEDVIIQRIKDMAWDDVVRKIKPVENPVEYKKKLVLDQEKSKLSLGEIYEKEYLKQLENKSEETAEKPEKELPEHQEIRAMMNSLFSKLDALSNFHFTPKQVVPEVKVISNLPAISMEEVAPVTVSDAALLAPEEVKPKLKGNLIGKSERTKTDKNRERRRRKLKQKLKYKQMKAKAKLQLENSNVKDVQKKMSTKLLQDITKSSNVTVVNETNDTKYIKSSNAFFLKLQNESKKLIEKKNIDGKKMRMKKKVNSKKSAVK